MKKQNFRLIYFDGFAGCGTIETQKGEVTDLIDSVAIRVIGTQSSAKSFT